MSALLALSKHFVEIAIPAPRSTGNVYLLVDGDEIVYVGQTTAIEQRIAWHWIQSQTPTVISKRTDAPTPNADCKRFTRAFAFEAPESELRAIESALIRALRPKYNRRADRYTGGDNAIISALGLPAHVDEKANAKEFRLAVHRPHGPRSERDKEIAAINRERRRRRPSQRRLRLRRALWRAVRPFVHEAKAS